MRGGRSAVFDWTAGLRRAVAGARLVGSRLAVVGKAASREGSCSCRSEAVVGGGTAPKGWKDGIEAAVAGTVAAGPHLPFVTEEAANEGAGRGPGCRVEEGHRRAGREECSAVAEPAVLVVVAVEVFAAGQESVA